MDIDDDDADGIDPDSQFRFSIHGALFFSLLFCSVLCSSLTSTTTWRDRSVVCLSVGLGSVELTSGQMCVVVVVVVVRGAGTRKCPAVVVMPPPAPDPTVRGFCQLRRAQMSRCPTRGPARRVRARPAPEYDHRGDGQKPFLGPVPPREKLRGYVTVEFTRRHKGRAENKNDRARGSMRSLWLRLRPGLVGCALRFGGFRLGSMGPGGRTGA